MEKTKKSRRGLKIAAAVAVLVIVVLMGALIFIGNYFYHFALDPNSDSFFGGGGGEQYESDPTPEQLWFDGGTLVQQTSEDGLALTAHQFFDQTGHRYAVICHGYGNRASGMAYFGMQFQEMGFNVLLPDARGHGHSEGDYVGMGWHERRDVVGWCNYILEQDPDAQIALFGVSMGAATVMMTSGEADLPDAVKVVIEDCGYTSVWDEFAAQLDQLFGLPTFPILNVTSLVTQAKVGWNFREASALEQVKKCTLPILFIHGEEDAFVPFEMVYPLYEAAQSPKMLLTVPGAEHGESSAVAPEEYWNTVTNFLAEYFPA